MMGRGDIIAAIATPLGRAGIGIVRVSGPRLAEFALALVGRPLTPRHAVLADFLAADKRVIDYGLALFFQAPHSYTGEDVLELQGHGGPVVLQLVLRRFSRFSQPSSASHSRTMSRSRPSSRKSWKV